MLEPTIDPTAYVAPTAVLSGDVRVGRNCRILHGAVLTAEGGHIAVGENSIVMETAVLRSTARNNLEIGSHCVIGTRATITGADIRDEVFIATGATIFNGAVIGSGSEVRVGATVHVRSVLADSSMVPIGWIAAGDPAQLFSPDQHDALWEVQSKLDFPGYVFGVGRTEETPMIEMTERWGRALGLHAGDQSLDGERPRNVSSL